VTLSAPRPARLSTSAALIKNGCGWRTLTVSWYVMLCPGQCREAVIRAPALIGYLYLINRYGFYPSRPHQVRRLGISSPVGSPIRRTTVIVVVPSGSEFSENEKVSSDVVHYLRWPTDFPGAPKTQPIGIYTVIWRTGVYSIIGCAGFVVRKVTFVASGSHNSRRLLNDPFLAKWIKRAATARAGG